MELAQAIKAAKRVYLCGNGGSAANAIHIANDLISVGIKAHALTADVATLTAIANDFGYEHIFAAQLRVFGEPGDLLIALSGSGRSPNILHALIAASELGVATIAIFGAFGSPKNVAETVISMGKTMQDAEESQLLLGHQAMLWLKANKS